MDIFYLDSRNFFSVEDEIIKYFGKDFKSEKRKSEHAFGRFLVKTVAENFYGALNSSIAIKDSKPYFLNCSLQFSISHSRNIILAAFDNNPVGIDIEFMKERNFHQIFRYYKLNIEHPDKELFYHFWTSYEARIKLHQDPVSYCSFKLFDEFMLSIVSSESLDISRILRIYELKRPNASTNPSELINLKLVSASNPKENTVVIQEINTASYEFLEPLNLKTE